MRRVWNFAVLLVALLLLAAVAPVAYVEALCRAPMQGYAPGLRFPTVLPAPERRREAASWLSYPHWHVVHSADSLGRHLATAPPSSYPYWQDVRGFWSSYCLVNQVTADMGGAGDYKLAIYGLGLRFSAGMLTKGLYENSLGRIFEWIGGWQSEDDRHAARVQQHYAAFIHQTPWYRFPYGTAFGDLWATGGKADRAAVAGLSSPRVRGEGDHPQGGGGVFSAVAAEPAESSFLRHWERRLALSGEYGVKAAFTTLTNAAMSAWGARGDRLGVRLVARASPGQLAAADPRLMVLRSVEGVGTVVAAPHDASFTSIVDRLAARGIELVEIAGNDDIFLTLLMPRPLDSAEGVVLMTHRLADRPTTLRVGVSTKAHRLHALLRDAKAAGATLERVYDY